MSIFYPVTACMFHTFCYCYLKIFKIFTVIKTTIQILSSVYQRTFKVDCSSFYLFICIKNFFLFILWLFAYFIQNLLIKWKNFHQNIGIILGWSIFVLWSWHYFWTYRDLFLWTLHCIRFDHTGLLQLLCWFLV